MAEILWVTNLIVTIAQWVFETILIPPLTLLRGVYQGEYTKFVGLSGILLASLWFVGEIIYRIGFGHQPGFTLEKLLRALLKSTCNSLAGFIIGLAVITLLPAAVYYLLTAFVILVLLTSLGAPFIFNFLALRIIDRSANQIPAQEIQEQP